MRLSSPFSRFLLLTHPFQRRELFCEFGDRRDVRGPPLPFNFRLEAIEHPTRQRQEICVLQLEGEIDLHITAALRTRFARHIDHRNVAVIVNFSGTTYIDSSGLATLIDAFQKIHAQNGRLVLSDMPQLVKAVFSVSRLDRYFQIFDTETEAVKFLRTEATTAAG